MRSVDAASYLRPAVPREAYNGSAVVDALSLAFDALGTNCVNGLLWTAYGVCLFWTLRFALALRAPTAFQLSFFRSSQRRSKEVESVLELLTKDPAFAQLRPDHGVSHVAVVMDGNRRYGMKHYGTGHAGHRAGADALTNFIRWSVVSGLEQLTVYAFSTENWQRSEIELATLMRLFVSYFQSIRDEAAEIGIRVRFLTTAPELLPPEVVALMAQVEAETRTNASIVVNVCVSYGSRSALVAASNRCVQRAGIVEEAGLRKELCRSLTELPDFEALANAAAENCTAARGMKNFAARSGLIGDSVDAIVNLGRGQLRRSVSLATDPQIFLRTSAELRLSNFMLFESAYSELFFVDKLWPEMTAMDLVGVLNDFAEKRQRRFGK